MSPACRRVDLPPLLAIAAALIGGACTAGAAAAAGDEEWAHSGRDPAGTYYSPLADIDRTTVMRLGVAWEYRLGTRRGLEATPLVIDGVMYAVGNWGRVYSLDAASGAERWRYDPKVDGQWGRYACCDVVNRGLAVADQRVYVGALDGYLHAIDAATGERIWKVDTLLGGAKREPYTLTGAPLVAGPLVIIGNAGADFKGVRGYVSAFDRRSGALVWRFFTVPKDPKLGPQDQPHLKRALATWDPQHRWEFGGGGTVWDGLAFDPELNLVYFGTGNASPYAIKEGGRRGGDDLYTDCIVAVHADSGRIAWYYQTVPADQWDYDSTQKMILAQLPIGGRTRKVLLQAAKNGYFYVLDRVTGELISAQNFAYVNWTRGLDPKSGRPRENPAAEYLAAPKLIFPSIYGAHSWQPMSFDQSTGLIYIPAVEAPMVFIETAARPAGYIDGNFTLGSLFPGDYDPSALRSLLGPLPALADLAREAPAGAVRSIGVLKAWDPVRQRLVWQRPASDLSSAGVLSTGGGLIVQGDAAGRLNFYDAHSGQLLRSLDLGTGILAAPMSYRLAGKQYIAVMAGYGGAAGLYYPFSKGNAAYRYENEGRIIAFALDGEPPHPPPALSEAPFERPPPREGSADEIARGEILYNRYCGRCHVFGRGLLPDLRRLPASLHANFDPIVLGGAFAPLGMGRFDDVLSREDAAAIHAYLLERAWEAYLHPPGAQ